MVHEDRNRLVAAAGSGKRFTLVTKVDYAIKVKTFHSFGKEIIESVENAIEGRLNIGSTLA